MLSASLPRGGIIPPLNRLDDDPTESVDVSAENPALVAQLQQALEEYPRGESVHIPVYRAAMDIDFFGGEEDRPSWPEFVVNSATQGRPEERVSTDK
jgi:hypothetical protein